MEQLSLFGEDERTRLLRKIAEEFQGMPIQKVKRLFKEHNRWGGSWFDDYIIGWWDDSVTVWHPDNREYKFPHTEIIDFIQ